MVALILAGEPTGALDTANGQAVLDLLTAFNTEGTTIAVITHDRDIAAALPRQVEIRDGRIVTDRPKPAISRTTRNCGATPGLTTMRPSP